MALSLSSDVMPPVFPPFVWDARIGGEGRHGMSRRASSPIGRACPIAHGLPDSVPFPVIVPPNALLSVRKAGKRPLLPRWI